MGPVEQTPSVGRVVHYVSYGTPNGEYKSEHRAAIITAVRNVGNPGEEPTYEVDICVFNPTGLFFNQNVRHEEPDMESTNVLSGGTWHWPERV